MVICILPSYICFPLSPRRHHGLGEMHWIGGRGYNLRSTLCYFSTNKLCGPRSRFRWKMRWFYYQTIFRVLLSPDSPSGKLRSERIDDTENVTSLGCTEKQDAPQASNHHLNWLTCPSPISGHGGQLIRRVCKLATGDKIHMLFF